MRVLICQPVDTRLKGVDRDVLGTVNMTVRHRGGTQHGIWVSQLLEIGRDIVKSDRYVVEGR
jgi:hypothetical protein